MSFIKTTLAALLLASSSLVFAAGTVDINTADAQTLQTLDGVGPAKAQAIIEYRQANGPFKSVEDLGKVQGIGEKTLQANRDRISVGKTAEPAKKKTAAN
ncbi:MAG TPA: helix-hairpin-helix domain-containing protein [Nevskiales bacterium]|nr:helix-hairpin-helix domain-containing protein [Nevskiales bacterium]